MIDHATGLIERLEYRAVDIPLRRPFRFATTELTSLPYAWLKVVTQDGVVGFGEAPTYWDPTGETQLAALGAFELWTPALVGSRIFDVRRISETLERTARGAYAARCAVETAILDALSKTMEVPPGDILGGVLSSVEVNAVLDLPVTDVDDNHVRLSDARSKLQAGYSVLKIKSSASTFELDVSLVAAIRKSAPAARLFVDANQSWEDGPTALRRIQRMADAGADWVEQPIHSQDFRGLRYLHLRSPLPIMLDESVTDYLSLAQHCMTETVHYANLKLAKAGGPFSAVKFVNVAEAHGVRYSIGSMIESGLGMLANYHVARATRPLTCGFDAYSLVDDGLNIEFERSGGTISRVDERAFGLGYELRIVEEAFERGWNPGK